MRGGGAPTPKALISGALNAPLMTATMKPLLVAAGAMDSRPLPLRVLSEHSSALLFHSRRRLAAAAAAAAPAAAAAAAVRPPPLPPLSPRSAVLHSPRLALAGAPWRFETLAKNTRELCGSAKTGNTQSPGVHLSIWTSFPHESVRFLLLWGRVVGGRLLLFASAPGFSSPTVEVLPPTGRYRYRWCRYRYTVMRLCPLAKEGSPALGPGP